MTLLSVAQEVALYTSAEQPAAIIGATDREVVELREILFEAAQRIAAGKDWAGLLVQATLTGDGATTSFSLPSDFDRMPAASQIWTSRLVAPLHQVIEPNDWLRLEVLDDETTTGSWMMQAGKLHVKPAPETAELLRYFYLSDTLWTAADGVTHSAAPAADTAVFRLPERLLKLGAIWMWRQAKGLDYAEQMRSFEEAFEEAAVGDRGARVVAVGRSRGLRGVEIAASRRYRP